MPQASLNALVSVYRDHMNWLDSQATEFERGERKVSARIGGKEVDISSNMAAEYRHKANNMAAIMQAYERIHAREER